MEVEVEVEVEVEEKHPSSVCFFFFSFVLPIYCTYLVAREEAPLCTLPSLRVGVCNQTSTLPMRGGGGMPSKRSCAETPLPCAPPARPDRTLNQQLP